MKKSNCYCGSDKLLYRVGFCSLSTNVYRGKTADSTEMQFGVLGLTPADSEMNDVNTAFIVCQQIKENLQATFKLIL